MVTGSCCPFSSKPPLKGSAEKFLCCPMVAVIFNRLLLENNGPVTAQDTASAKPLGLWQTVPQREIISQRLMFW